MRENCRNEIPTTMVSNFKRGIEHQGTALQVLDPGNLRCPQRGCRTCIHSVSVFDHVTEDHTVHYLVAI